MASKMEMPMVRQYNANDWEFIYPSSIDNEKVNGLFWDNVNLLDYDDYAAEMAFKKLIAKHPFFLDAYNHLSLAFRNQGKGFESLLTAEKSFHLGKSFFPVSFNFKKDKLSWLNLENRPFLRACQIYGLECQCHKKYAEAIDAYRLNLSLNEDDHQGIRYLLLESFFAKKDYKNAGLLIGKYDDDFSIEFKFGAVALAALEGDLKLADKRLVDAIKTNPFFMELASSEKPKMPLRVSGTPPLLASAQLAYEYWERNKSLYRLKPVIEYFSKKYFDGN